MKRALLVLFAVLPALAAADAKDIASSLWSPGTGAISSRHDQGNATPLSLLKGPRSDPETRSTAALEPTPRPGRMRYLLEDGPHSSGAGNRPTEAGMLPGEWLKGGFGGALLRPIAPSPCGGENSNAD